MNADLSSIVEVFIDPVCWFLLISASMGQMLTSITLPRFATTLRTLHILSVGLGSFAALSILEAVEAPRPVFDASFWKTFPIPFAIVAVTHSITLLTISAAEWLVRRARQNRNSTPPEQDTHGPQPA